MSKLLYTSDTWDFPMLQRIQDACEEIAVEELKLDTYSNSLEIITADQMLEAYTSHGLPVDYKHWSRGKQYVRESQSYQKGRSGLAYEIVVNTNPCINYLMEENTSTMMALVIAHAAYGHNSFFKGNYLYRQWTDADGIVDYLTYAKNYIEECEQKYGFEEVEQLLDACHALKWQGLDKYKRPSKLSKETRESDRLERLERERLHLNELWYRTTPQKDIILDEEKNFPARPEENVLYFLEKHAPNLKTWEREVVRIVRKISQYFYPNFQTQVMNEGWASFTHHYIMTRLHDKKLISDGNYIEFMASHSGVLYQPQYSAQFNPYHLGFNMYHDIKRMCVNPTDEDKEWFPETAGKPWLETITHAMKNYRDESFIRQFLSPHMIRKHQLFAIHDDENNDEIIISEIHNKEGYRKIRDILADSKSIANMFPDIQVTKADLKGDRTLYLTHIERDGIELDEEDCNKTLQYLHRLWGYPVVMQVKDPKGNSIVDIRFPEQDQVQPKLAKVYHTYTA